MDLSQLVLYLLAVALLGFVAGVCTNRLFAISRYNTMVADMHRRREKYDSRVAVLEGEQTDLQQQLLASQQQAEQQEKAADDRYHQVEQLKLDVGVRDKHVNELESRLDAANRLLDTRRQQANSPAPGEIPVLVKKAAKAAKAADEPVATATQTGERAARQPTFDDGPEVADQRYRFERDSLMEQEVDEDIAEITGAFQPMREPLETEPVSGIPAARVAPREQHDLDPETASGAPAADSKQPAGGLFSGFNRRKDRR